MPDASAQAFDEARELFLSQMKIVSYYLHVRPIVKKVSNDEIVRFGYGKGSSDSLHFGESRRRIFATGPLSSLLRLVTKWSICKESLIELPGVFVRRVYLAGWVVRSVCPSRLWSVRYIARWEIPPVCKNLYKNDESSGSSI